MRALVGLVAALGVLVIAPAADASAQRRTAKQQSAHDRTRKGHKTPKTAKKRAARIRTIRERDNTEGREIRELREPARGQSIGAPWEGRLQKATELPPGDGYHIRRPTRAFGTE